MTGLSDTQLVILTAACQRPNRLALPLPDRLKGGAAQKVVASLIERGLIEEVAAKPGDPVWRAADDGGASTTLVATDAVLSALGIEAASAPTGGPQQAGTAAAGSGRRRKETAAGAPTAAPARKTREGTKQAALIVMLERREGATLDELVEVTAWQPHTVRGALAGALKKRLGLTVESEKIEGRGRVYRIGR
jgi:hypothetical protein